MLDSSMEAKRLDLNAPLLSVRRHSAPLPAPPSSSSSAIDAAASAPANSGAEDGGRGRTAAGQGSRRSSLPFYKSDLKSGPVRNAGAIPFVWEQSPGRPKGGAGGAPVKPVREPLLAPKPPPGRVTRRLSDEKEEPIRIDTSNVANDGVPTCGSPPIASACTSTATSAGTVTTAVTATSSNGPFSASSGSSREASKANSRPVIEKAPILEEDLSSSDGGDGEEEDAFSDALDTLSRAETCFMSCSVSGLTVGATPRGPSGRFSTDPSVRDFMMGRFLPAAQAMAASPSPYASRKPSVPSREPARRVIGSAGDARRQAVPLPRQHVPNYGVSYAHRQVSAGSSGNGEDDDQDEEDGYGGAGHLSMKGCGLLPRFCMKSSFCLLNPVPGMKVRGRVPMPAARRLRPQVRASHHWSVEDAENESWEEVYRHKLGRLGQTVGEEASKLTSESNQLSYWSDSQTADGSSSYRHSTGGGFSPCRNGMSSSPLHEGKGFDTVANHAPRGGDDDDVFELCDKSSEKCWEVLSHPGSKRTSGSQSPVIEKTVYVDSIEVFEDPGSKLSLSNIKGVMNCMETDSELAGKNQIIEENLVLEACEDVASQHKFTEVVDAGELCFAERSPALKIMGNVKGHFLDDQQHLEAENERKKDVNALQALLPPPLPQSPSESWLGRTLPSVASKNSAPLSFLGVQFCPKKQVIRASSTDPRRETMIRKSGVPKGRHMRFADVLARPASED